MAEAGSGAIYRIDTAGDTETTARDVYDPTQVIEFNSGAVPDATGKMTGTSFQMVRSVNFHPNPRRALDKIQDGLLSYIDVTITGYFINHDTTIGPQQFYDWMKDPATNASLPFGRFGLRLDDFGAVDKLLDFVPIATSGYILYDVFVEDLEVPRDEVGFIAKLYRNGTP